MNPSDYVLVGTAIVLMLLILYQLWKSADTEDMEMLIDQGVLYVNNRRFCSVSAGNGSSNFEYSRHPVTVKYSPLLKCEMVYGEGFGWIGAHPECDAILGNVRNRGVVLADVMAQERLRVNVLDALLDGKSVSLEIRHG